MKSLVGSWKLIKTESVAANGNKLPAPYGGQRAMGTVTFAASGRMICVLCDSANELPPGEKREYNSYCGNYRFDGQQLITVVDASANPAWMNTEQVRDVHFEGDTLVLRPPLRAYAAEPEQRTLYWQRMDGPDQNDD